MKFLCGDSEKGYFRKRESWHVWFAWYPVTIGIVNDKNKCAWLERVCRKGEYSDYYGWIWEHKALEDYVPQS